LLLQIIDVFVPELNKVNAEISLANLAALLEPFLHTLANTKKCVDFGESARYYFLAPLAG